MAFAFPIQRGSGDGAVPTAVGASSTATVADDARALDSVSVPYQLGVKFTDDEVDMSPFFVVECVSNDATSLGIGVAFTTTAVLVSSHLFRTSPSAEDTQIALTFVFSDEERVEINVSDVIFVDMPVHPHYRDATIIRFDAAPKFLERRHLHVVSWVDDKETTILGSKLSGDWSDLRCTVEEETLLWSLSLTENRLAGVTGPAKTVFERGTGTRLNVVVKILMNTPKGCSGSPVFPLGDERLIKHKENGKMQCYVPLLGLTFSRSNSTSRNAFLNVGHVLQDGIGWIDRAIECLRRSGQKSQGARELAAELAAVASASQDCRIRQVRVLGEELVTRKVSQPTKKETATYTDLCEAGFDYLSGGQHSYTFSGTEKGKLAHDKTGRLDAQGPSVNPQGVRLALQNNTHGKPSKVYSMVVFPLGKAIDKGAFVQMLMDVFENNAKGQDSGFTGVATTAENAQWALALNKAEWDHKR